MVIDKRYARSAVSVPTLLARVNWHALTGIAAPTRARERGARRFQRALTQSDLLEPPGRRCGCWSASPFRFSGLVRRFWFGATMELGRSMMMSAGAGAARPTRSSTTDRKICSTDSGLLGKKITLADVAVMPALVRMDDLGLPGWQDLPRIVTWFDNIRAHPAFKPTYYPGSLLSEHFPHLREKAPA
jgi:hypothetical protein